MIRRIRLETVTPLHIGAREREITPLEMVIRNRKCYAINEPRLSKVLYDHKLVDAFCIETNAAGSGFRVGDFLRARGLDTEQILEGVAEFVAAVKTERPINSFRPCIRDAYARPYIPGSSLKGAFRTAVFYEAVRAMKERHREEFERQIVQKVRNVLDQFEREDAQGRRPSAQWYKKNFVLKLARLEEHLLQRFNLPIADRERVLRRPPPGVPAQNRDFMRVLQVSDSNALERDATEIRDVLVLSMNTGNNELREKTRMAVECIPAGVSLEFTVSLDDKVFSYFRAQNQGQLPFTSLDELFEQISRFAAFEWLTDQDFFGRIVKPGGISTAEIARFYEGVKANFRLGWGSGLSGTTIVNLLPEDLRLRIRDKLFDYRPTNVFPKSRRVLAQDGIPTQPLGWAKIQVVG